MALIKTSGLVLKYVNLNDNDRLFTIFTSDMGKITAMSKGIRSHKHKDFAALGLYCFSELVLDDSRGLIYINSAQLKENFYNLRTMLEKTSLVSYFTDLVSFLSDEISGDAEFFSFILNTIYLTAKAEPGKIDDIESELLRIKTIFEIKCVCISGYMPDVISCAKCNSKEKLFYFDTVGGKAVCEKCFENYFSPEILKCDENALKIIAYICNCDYKSVFKFKASPESIKSANEISERYLVNKLEYLSPALEYYKSL